MSDVINGVPRELLEQIETIVRGYNDRSPVLKPIRALLSEQPQASAAQSAPARIRMPVRLHDVVEETDFPPNYANGYNTALDHVLALNAAPAQPAAHDQGEVQRLREALEKFEPYLAEKVHYASDAADDCRYWRLELFIRTPARNPEPFDIAAEKWIRAALAASTGQEVKP